MPIHCNEAKTTLFVVCYADPKSKFVLLLDKKSTELIFGPSGSDPLNFTVLNFCPDHAHGSSTKCFPCLTYKIQVLVSPQPVPHQ